jgi:hypothetical protein
MRFTTRTLCPRERLVRSTHSHEHGHKTDRDIAAGRYTHEQLDKVVRVNSVHGVHVQSRPAGAS